MAHNRKESSTAIFVEDKYVCLKIRSHLFSDYKSTHIFDY